MDDNGKQASSYQLDQDILDARGINMTVAEVAGLPTCKYTERVQGLKLSEGDLAFLKGLRRRIKNRLASQNSRRRSVEHLRRLARELRAVRACRRDALSERRALLDTRSELRSSFGALRAHVAQTLKDRSDPTEIPDLDLESHSKENKIDDAKLTESPSDVEARSVFECRIEKLVQQSVHHVYRERERRLHARTAYLERDQVLDLCVKETRRHHGRKQLAPRRVACCSEDDGVLDLKIKKESQ